MSPSRYVLGIDGGGSRTRAVLARLTDAGDTDVVGRGASGAGNPLLAGHRQALDHLDEAISQAMSQGLAQVPGGGAGANEAPHIDHAVLALAGASGKEERQLIEQWVAGRGDIRQYSLVPDWLPVLTAGTPCGRGIGLIAGTGSVAFGRDDNDRLLRQGGWGHWFGDLGSGFDLGRQALTAIAGAADGLAPDTVLATVIPDHFGVPTPHEITELLARHDSPRRAIASLAPLVLDAAESGDPVAITIRASGAQYLAEIVASTVRALDLSPGYALALAGSVICKNTGYRELVLDTLSDSDLRPGPVTPVDEPVMGCITIARDELKNAGNRWRHHA